MRSDQKIDSPKKIRDTLRKTTNLSGNQPMFDKDKIADMVSTYGDRYICRHCGNWLHNSSRAHAVCSNPFCLEARLQPRLDDDELHMIAVYKAREELRSIPSAHAVSTDDQIIDTRPLKRVNRAYRIDGEENLVYRCAECLSVIRAMKVQRKCWAIEKSGVVAKHPTSIHGFGRFTIVPGRRLTSGS